MTEKEEGDDDVIAGVEFMVETEFKPKNDLELQMTQNVTDSPLPPIEEQGNVVDGRFETLVNSQVAVAESLINMYLEENGSQKKIGLVGSVDIEHSRASYFGQYHDNTGRITIYEQGLTDWASENGLDLENATLETLVHEGVHELS